MPTGVLITHILALAELAGSRSFKSPPQQNIFIPCCPPQTQKSSSSPVNTIIHSSVSPRRLWTGALTFPHGAVGSLEMPDKEVLQSFLDYLMPLVPEVVGQSRSPPLKKKKFKLAAPSEEGRKAENIPVPSG